jgi:hypothetical protein
MARPTKEGLEYFPLDTDIDQDEKVIVVVAKFGMKGFGVIVRLMMEIYKNGYYYHWSEKEQYIFSMKVGEPVEYVNEVVQECMKWGFFHQEIYEANDILTSKGFQKRFMLAANRRKGIQIKDSFNLIEEVSVDKSRVIDDINFENVDINTPKEKKEKENKRNKDLRQKQVYDEESIPYRLAKYLHDAIKKNLPEHKEPNMQAWSEDMRKIVELDQREPKQVAKVIKWVQSDTFWWKNVMSPAKLRKQYEVLLANIRTQQKTTDTPKKQVVDPRDKDIEFQKFLAEGGNPDDFDWGS